MAVPKNKRRTIAVDGIVYQWTVVSGSNCFIMNTRTNEQFTVQWTDPNGCHKDQLTPSKVEYHIRQHNTLLKDHSIQPKTISELLRHHPVHLEHQFYNQNPPAHSMILYHRGDAWVINDEYPTHTITLVESQNEEAICRTWLGLTIDCKSINAVLKNLKKSGIVI